MARYSSIWVSGSKELILWTAVLGKMILMVLWKWINDVTECPCFSFLCHHQFLVTGKLIDSFSYSYLISFQQNWRRSNVLEISEVLKLDYPKICDHLANISWVSKEILNQMHEGRYIMPNNINIFAKGKVKQRKGVQICNSDVCIKKSLCVFGWWGNEV